MIFDNDPKEELKALFVVYGVALLILAGLVYLFVRYGL